MNVRHAAVHAVALAAATCGVWLVVGEDETPPAGGDGSTPAVPGDGGGYLGTGRPQVVLEPTSRPTAQTRGTGTGEVETPRQLEARRRMHELQRVLANFENEAVYVEGVDGPAPDRSKGPPSSRSPAKDR